MRKTIAIITALVLVVGMLACGFVPASADATKTIVLRLHDSNAYVDGEKTTIDDVGTIPFTLNNVTMVPIRFVTEKLGATVSYTGATLPITVTFGDTTLSFLLDSNLVTVETPDSVTTFEMVVPARIVAGKTYIPLRAISENLGFWVKYIQEDHSIIIADEELTGSAYKEQVALGKTLEFPNIKIKSISMDPSGKKFVESSKKKVELDVTVTPANATLAHLVIYTSSNPSVAKVTSNGTVQIVGEGITVITAANNNGKIAATLNLIVGSKYAYELSAQTFLEHFFETIEPVLDEFYDSSGKNPRTYEYLQFDIFKRTSFQNDAATLNTLCSEMNKIISDYPGADEGNESVTKLIRTINTAISNIAARAKKSSLDRSDKNYIIDQFNAITIGFKEVQLNSNSLPKTEFGTIDS